MNQHALPTACISVHQPFPYFIFHLPPEYRCDVLNREWGPSEFRGWVWIRAGKKPSKPEFYRGLRFAEDAFVPGTEMPALETLPVKGIVGRVQIVGCHLPGHSRGRWHDPKQFGYMIGEVERVDFVPCDGAQGLFQLPRSVLEQLGKVA